MVEEPISVLVVEDEPLLRDILAKQLATEGFQVRLCTTAADALAEVREEPTRWSLALVDNRLPDLSGKDLLRRMLQIQPAMRFVLTSGLPVNLEELPLQHPGQARILQKPFTFGMLREAISEVLG